MGKFLVEFCTNCGLISFGLCGSLQRSKVGHQILWSGVEWKLVKLHCFFFSLKRCTPVLISWGSRKGRERKGALLTQNSEFSKKRYFLRSLY